MEVAMKRKIGFILGLVLLAAVCAAVILALNYAFDRHDFIRQMFNGPAAQNQVLRMVYILTRAKTEGVPLKMLAEQLQLSPGTVSEAVEKLVRKQMLDRTVCPTDRRSVHIRVSEQGMEAINLGIDQLRKDQKALLELLSEEETQTLLRLLTKLAENVPDLTAKPV